MERENCNIDTVVKLVNAGADVNHEDSMGRTALIYAVQIGSAVKCFATENHSVDCVSVLMKKGADVNKQDNEGNSPLILATRRDTGYVQALIKGRSQCGHIQ